MTERPDASDASGLLLSGGTNVPGNTGKLNNNTSSPSHDDYQPRKRLKKDNEDTSAPNFETKPRHYSSLDQNHEDSSGRGYPSEVHQSMVKWNTGIQGGLRTSFSLKASSSKLKQPDSVASTFGMVFGQETMPNQPVDTRKRIGPQAQGTTEGSTVGMRSKVKAQDRMGTDGQLVFDIGSKQRNVFHHPTENKAGSSTGLSSSSRSPALQHEFQDLSRDSALRAKLTPSGPEIKNNSIPHASLPAKSPDISHTSEGHSDLIPPTSVCKKSGIASMLPTQTSFFGSQSTL